jgi:hypothetical protein
LACGALEHKVRRSFRASMDIAESIRERSGIATGTAFSSPAALPVEGSGLLALPAGPHLACRSQDRAHDPLLPGTAAQIAADCYPYRGAVLAAQTMAVSRSCSRRHPQDWSAAPLRRQLLESTEQDCAIRHVVSILRLSLARTRE